MPNDLSLRCRCGRVRGVAAGASAKTGNRIVCYCDDCQAFAHFLERDDVLDAQGGSDIFQVAPASLRITEGADQLRCVRLSPKGLYRWYTECCRTPVGNTMPGVPFVGLVQPIVDHASDGRTRDEALGQPVAFVHGRAAIGGCPPHAHARASMGDVARLAPKILSWWLGGKGNPSPFFDAKTKAPKVTPRVLEAAEREGLRGGGGSSRASNARASG